MEFDGFPKMARLSREVVITEKIDGTNAQIVITADGSGPYTAFTCGYYVYAGSRNRWITPDDDNFGFANWVYSNCDEILQLGEGKHFGEWYGKGIQRGYGLNHKRFALFNTSRWDVNNTPNCCDVVPVLYRGNFDTGVADSLIDDLRVNGSVAVPGFMNPEGIVIYHTAAGVGFKKTLYKDESPKSLVV